MRERFLSRRDAVKALAVGAGVAAFASVAGCSTGGGVPRDLKIWDLVEFGSYPQDVSGDAAPIAWRVLDVVDGAALLVSERALDCRPYNEERVECTWADCSLRAWLNGEFLNSAFSEKERARVVLTRVVNADNEEHWTEGDPDTRDSAFLLSFDEATYYFASDFERACCPTDYVISRGAWTGDNGACSWWLRSRGSSDYALSVSDVGSVYDIGHYVGVDSVDVAVRPALWLDLES